MFQISCILALILTALTTLVSAKATISGCLDDGIPQWVITIPGGDYTYTELVLTASGGNGLFWRDPPIDINSQAVTVVNRGDSSTLNTTIQGFSSSETAVITVYGSDLCTGDSFDASIVVTFEQFSGTSTPVTLEAVAESSCGASSSASATSAASASTEPETTAASTSAEPSSTAPSAPPAPQGVRMSGCIDDNSNPKWLVVVPGTGDFSQITLTGDAGSNFEFAGQTVFYAHNYQTFDFKNKVDPEHLDATIDGGFNSSLDVGANVFGVASSKDDSFALSIDVLVQYASYVRTNALSATASSLCSTPTSVVSSPVTSMDSATTAVPSASSTDSEVTSSAAPVTSGVDSSTIGSSTAVASSMDTQSTSVLSASSLASSAVSSAIASSAVSSAIASSGVSSAIANTTSVASPTSGVKLPSITGFDDDGAAGWIIAVPKGFGPYADLKLSGSAGGKFDWEQYAEAGQGSPEFSGDRRKLEVDVTDFHGNQDYFLTVFGEPHSLTAVETIVATLTLNIEYDGSFGGLRKRAAASSTAFTIEGTATVTPVASSSSAVSHASSTSVVSSSISSSFSSAKASSSASSAVSSSAASSSSSSSVASSGLLTVVTTVLPSTTVVTITSCSDGKCTATPVTTGLTTVTDVDTVYTTYCPLTAVATTKTYTPVVLTTTISASPESTTTLTITSCSDNKCSSSVVTTGLAKTTGTVDGTTTVYTTYCPLSDEILTTTIYETSTVVTGSAAETSAVVSSSSAAPAVASLSTFSGLGASLTPIAGTIFGSLAFVAALFV